jgi:hypothetical protein
MTLMVPSEMEIGKAHLRASFGELDACSGYNIESASDRCELAERLDLQA